MRQFQLTCPSSSNQKQTAHPYLQKGQVPPVLSATPRSSRASTSGPCGFLMAAALPSDACPRIQSAISAKPSPLWVHTCSPRTSPPEVRRSSPNSKEVQTLALVCYAMCSNRFSQEDALRFFPESGTVRNQLPSPAFPAEPLLTDISFKRSSVSQIQGC